MFLACKPQAAWPHGARRSSMSTPTPATPCARALRGRSRLAAGSAAGRMGRGHGGAWASEAPRRRWRASGRCGGRRRANPLPQRRARALASPRFARGRGIVDRQTERTGEPVAAGRGARGTAKLHGSWDCRKSAEWSSHRSQDVCRKGQRFFQPRVAVECEPITSSGIRQIWRPSLSLRFCLARARPPDLQLKGDSVVVGGTPADAQPSEEVGGAVALILESSAVIDSPASPALAVAPTVEPAREGEPCFGPPGGCPELLWGRGAVRWGGAALVLTRAPSVSVVEGCARRVLRSALCMQSVCGRGCPQVSLARTFDKSGMEGCGGGESGI